MKLNTNILTKSITDQQKDLKRIFPSGHPRVSVKAYHDMNPQGKVKTSYVEIEGPSSYVDAYKKWHSMVKEL